MRSFEALGFVGDDWGVGGVLWDGWMDGHVKSYMAGWDGLYNARRFNYQRGGYTTTIAGSFRFIFFINRGRNRRIDGTLRISRSIITAKIEESNLYKYNYMHHHHHHNDVIAAILAMPTPCFHRRV